MTWLVFIMRDDMVHAHEILNITEILISFESFKNSNGNFLHAYS